MRLDDTRHAAEERLRLAADADLLQERMLGLCMRKRASEERVESTLAQASRELATCTLARRVNGKRGAVWRIAMRSGASDETARQFPRARRIG